MSGGKGKKGRHAAGGASRLPFEVLSPCRVLEERCSLDSRHGHVHLREILALDADRLAEAGKDEELAGFRADRAVFFDLETTGLSTTGTVAFLVGAGHLEGDELVLRQYFLEEPDAEEAMLRQVHDYLREFDYFVSYNGRNFDLPILRSRFAFRGVAGNFESGRHLDLLHTARRRWRGELPSCRLKEVERGLLGIRRIGDVEGFQIPPLYQHYLRTGRPELLEPVFFHNLMDVKSLVALTILAARDEVLIGEGEGEALGPGGASRRPVRPSASAPFRREKWRSRAGIDGDVPTGARKVNETRAPGGGGGHRHKTLRDLSLLLKKRGKWEDAARLWGEMAAEAPRDPFPHLELAKYYEHRAGDPDAALSVVERFLGLFLRDKGPDAPGGLIGDLQNRRRRLSAKSARRARG